MASLRHLEPGYVAQACNEDSSSMLGSAHFVHDLSKSLHEGISRRVDHSESAKIVDDWRTEFNDSVSNAVSPRQVGVVSAFAVSYADARIVEDHLLFHRAPLEQGYGVEGNHSDDVRALTQGVRRLSRASSNESIEGFLRKDYDQINAHIRKTENTVGVQRELLAMMPRELWLRYMMPPDRNLENFFDELANNRMRLEDVLIGHSSPHVVAASHNLASYFSLVQTFAGRHQSRLEDTEIWADATSA